MVLFSANGVASNKRHVSFNNEPEIRYRTASEASSTSTYRNKCDTSAMDFDDSTFDFDLESNNKSYLSSRSIKHRKTISACEKSFDSLINKNCSWSYRTFDENKTINSSPQGFSSVTSYVPSNKKHQNGNSTNINGITKEKDNHIKQNTNETDSSLIIPSSSESIFDNLSFENKIPSSEKTKNDNSIKKTSPKRMSLRTSKPVNYTIDISSESSSDEEMVLQTRLFNDTNFVDSKNYNSNHNSNGNDDVFNQTTPNISSKVNKLRDSFPKNKVLYKGINASENFNSVSCLNESTNENDSEEDLNSNSRKMKINHDAAQITDETKMNQDNTVNGNKSERKNFNSTEADKISKIKEARRKEHESRINDSQSKWKLVSSKSTTSAKGLKNYDLTFDDLVCKPYIPNDENVDNYSDSNRNSCPSFSNLLNSDEEIGVLSPNIDDFSDESEDDEIIMSSYLVKDESKNPELEQDERNPQDTELSEYASPSPIPESYYTKKQVSDKYKDIKNTNLQHEISLNVCSEVESIGNKTEMSGSISESEEITFDFLNGSLDLEKYKSTRRDESSTREKQNCPIQKSKQITEKNPKSTKRSKQKQPVKKVKSQTLKEKTLSQLKNRPPKSKKLYKHQDTEKQSTLIKRKATEKTKQTSEHITLRSNFSKRNKTAQGIYVEASPVNNHTQITRNKVATNRNGRFPKQKPPRREDITLGVSKNKNSKGTEDLLFLESNEYNISSSNEFQKENTQNDVLIEKPVRSQSRDFEDNTYSQNNYLSNSRNIQTREKNVMRSGKNTKKILKFDSNKKVSTRESCKNNGIIEIYTLSSGNEEDNAENEIHPILPKNTTKKNIQTWGDLETLLLTNDADKVENEVLLTNATGNSSEESIQALSNTEIFSNTMQRKERTLVRKSLNKRQRNASKRENNFQSSDNSPVQNVPNRSSTLDIIKTIPSRYSFNKHFKKLTIPENNLENEKQISTLLVKNSPSISIIERTIAKMKNCATPYLKTESEASQLDRTESYDESNEDKSPVLTEYSYAIQEFKSTMYFTANNKVSTTKETCFSRRTEKSAIQENEAIFSTQNCKRHMQNNLVDSVKSSKEILPFSHSVSLKPISTRLTNSSPTHEMNKDVTSVRRKQKIIMTPDVKIASNSLTIKNNDNILTREEKVEVDYKRKDLNKKTTLNELDSFVSETEDRSSSQDSIDFNISRQIDEQKNYNLRKRKCHNNNEEAIDKNQEAIKKYKRESNSSDQQLYNSEDSSNLKTKKIPLLNNHPTEQEHETTLNSAIKRRKMKSNIESRERFPLNRAKSERKEIYSNGYLNKSSNLIQYKQNDRADSSDMNSIQNDVFDLKRNTNEQNEDSLNSKGVITSSYETPSNKSNKEKVTVSQFVEETKNSSSKPLKENKHLALSSSKQEEKQTYDEYTKYLKELSQQEYASSEASGNNEYSPSGSCKTKTRKCLKQKHSKPLNEDEVNDMAETSDDDVFSISSFDTESEGNEVPHTKGTGFLFDVLNE